MTINEYLNKKLKKLFPNNNFEILQNKKRGQSLTFTVKDKKDKPLCMVKFFEYIDSEELKQKIKEAEEINSIEYILDNIESILETSDIDLEKEIELINLNIRCFDRYVKVCNIENQKCFPNLICFNREVVLDKLFYGFLVEEFVDGETLEELIKEKQNLDLEFILEFLEQMGEKIKEMNKNGIVHRDISPDNIMYSNNEFILIDPGMVKISDDNITTKSNYILGKRFYVSPEQFLGHAKKATFTSDLYSLGIIILEIILEQNPLKKIMEQDISNKTPHEILLSKYDRKIEDLFYDKLDEGEVTSLLLIIIKKMIQVEYNKRYDNIDSFLMNIQTLKERMI